jgi:hypothetical protein
MRSQSNHNVSATKKAIRRLKDIIFVGGWGLGEKLFANFLNFVGGLGT